MTLLAQSRPRRASEILDAAFQLYRAHFVVLVTIYAAVTLPPAILNILIPGPVGVIIGLLGGLLVLFGQGAVAVFVAAVMTDAPITAGEAYRRIRHRMGTLVGVQVVVGVLVLVGMILLIIPGIFALIATAVAPVVAVIEDQSVDSALRRSRFLTRGHAWHVVGTALLSVVILLVLVTGGAIVVTLLTASSGAGDATRTGLTAILNTLAYPFVAVTNTLLYFDLRIRREGADLEALVNQAPVASTPGPLPAPGSPSI